TFANLRANADGADPKNQRDSIKVSGVLASIGANLSFIKTELLTLYKDTMNKYNTEQPQLKNYQKILKAIVEKKPYTLSPELEEALATLSEVHEAPYMIYERSKSSDMEFDPIRDKDGNDLPMSFSLYEDRYELSSNTDLRRKAYESFTNTLKKYENTYAYTYAIKIKKKVTIYR